MLSNDCTGVPLVILGDLCPCGGGGGGGGGTSTPSPLETATLPGISI